jgi:toxin ParE1/3/4
VSLRRERQRSEPFSPFAFRLSPLFRQDLRGIGSYIAQDNLPAAISFVERLLKRCRDLAEFPGTGRKRDDIKQGYKSATEGDYVVIFQPKQGEIVIVRILHGKQDVGKAFSEGDKPKN